MLLRVFLFRFWRARLWIWGGRGFRPGGGLAAVRGREGRGVGGWVYFSFFSLLALRIGFGHCGL